MNRPYEPYPPPVIQDPSKNDCTTCARSHMSCTLCTQFLATGGLTGLIAIILDYSSAATTSARRSRINFTWQIRTFWWALLGHVIGFLRFCGSESAF